MATAAINQARTNIAQAVSRGWQDFKKDAKKELFCSGTAIVIAHVALRLIPGFALLSNPVGLVITVAVGMMFISPCVRWAYDPAERIAGYANRAYQHVRAGADQLVEQGREVAQQAQQIAENAVEEGRQLVEQGVVQIQHVAVQANQMAQDVGERVQEEAEQVVELVEADRRVVQNSVPRSLMVFTGTAALALGAQSLAGNVLPLVALPILAQDAIASGDNSVSSRLLLAGGKMVIISGVNYLPENMQRVVGPAVFGALVAPAVLRMINRLPESGLVSQESADVLGRTAFTWTCLKISGDLMKAYLPPELQGTANKAFLIAAITIPVVTETALYLKNQAEKAEEGMVEMLAMVGADEEYPDLDICDDMISAVVSLLGSLVGYSSQPAQSNANPMNIREVDEEGNDLDDESLALQEILEETGPSLHQDDQEIRIIG